MVTKSRAKTPDILRHQRMQLAVVKQVKTAIEAVQIGDLSAGANPATTVLSRLDPKVVEFVGGEPIIRAAANRTARCKWCLAYQRGKVYWVGGRWTGFRALSVLLGRPCDACKTRLRSEPIVQAELQGLNHMRALGLGFTMAEADRATRDGKIVGGSANRMMRDHRRRLRALDDRPPHSKPVKGATPSTVRLPNRDRSLPPSANDRLRRERGLTAARLPDTEDARMAPGGKVVDDPGDLHRLTCSDCNLDAAHEGFVRPSRPERMRIGGRLYERRDGVLRPV